MANSLSGGGQDCEFASFIVSPTVGRYASTSSIAASKAHSMVLGGGHVRGRLVLHRNVYRTMRGGEPGFGHPDLLLGRLVPVVRRTTSHTRGSRCVQPTGAMDQCTRHIGRRPVGTRCEPPDRGWNQLARKHNKPCRVDSGLRGRHPYGRGSELGDRRPA